MGRLFDEITKTMATPLSRRRALGVAGGVAAASAIEALPLSDAAAGSQEHRGRRLLRQLIEELNHGPESIPSSELMRVGLVDRVSRQSGIPFRKLWQRFHHIAKLDQTNHLATTTVDAAAPSQASVSVSAQHPVAAHRFRPLNRTTAISGIEIRNTGSGTGIVVLEGGTLFATKVLGPNDSIQIKDPVVIDDVVIAAIVIVGFIVLECGVDGSNYEIKPSEERCHTQINTVRCNRCLGGCGAHSPCRGRLEDCYWPLLNQRRNCRCK